MLPIRPFGFLIAELFFSQTRTAYYHHLCPLGFLNLVEGIKLSDFLKFKYGLDYGFDAIIASLNKSSDGLFNFPEGLGTCLVQGFIGNLFWDGQ